MPGETTRPNIALLIGLTWLAVMVELLFAGWSAAGRSLLDTDDALRLVQVREFLSSHGWFDLHIARLGPPGGYDSHWSRLIDAGLAGLFLFFHLFTGTELAERLMRVTWPLLWLLPAIAAVSALAWRIAGRQAALVALVLVLVGMPAFSQFRPGRIDHHNVQIALALGALALAAWCEVTRRAAAALGALTGLALGIGLENLLFVVIAGAAPALHFVVDRRHARTLRNYGLMLAASTFAAFLVSVGPTNWGHAVCDTMAVNWMAPVVAAGLLLAAAGQWLRDGGIGARVAAIAATAGISAAIWLALEPRCIEGPFALMDPGLRAIWLAHVAEIQPLAKLMQESPAIVAWIVGFPAAALIATAALSREGDMRRNPAFLIAALAFAVATAITVGAAKMYNYAFWMGMPLMAAWSLRLFGRFHLTTLAARAFAVVLLAPATLSLGAVAAVKAATHGEVRLELNARDRLGCFDSANYVQLARLPKGVIATDVDYGPFILALTPHSVLAGPYHRLPAGILAAHQVFALPPDGARDVIARHDVAYLATCGDYALVGVTDAERAASLWHRISTGDPPDWLEKMPAAKGDAFSVYRVKPGVP